MNINSFLRIYKNLANNIVREEELIDLYWDLQDRIVNMPDFICKSHNKSHDVKEKFLERVPDVVTASIAIDAIAHTFHQGGEEVLRKIYPSSDYGVVKDILDGLAGNDLKSQVRQYNRDYFTTLLTEDTGLLQLEKQEKQVGRTIKEDIIKAIEEYERLFNAGIASKGEILTLARFYPEDERYSKIVIEKGLLHKEPMVVGGPASVEMVDREGHLITVEALDSAFYQFMLNPRTRNSAIIHCLAPGNKIYRNGGRSGKGGYIDIQDIEVGDTVLTHAGVFRKVRKVMKHNNLDDYLVVLTLKNKEVIKVTPEHKILTNTGWIEAKDLTLESILMTPEFPGAVKSGSKMWPNGNPNKGKKLEDIVGEERAEEMKLIMSQNGKNMGSSGKGAEITASQRRGKTWLEVYGHKRPQYKDMGGENNSNWRGGLPRRDYDWSFNKKKRLYILERDNYLCQICGKSNESEMEDFGRSLCIHHIDYDKKNSKDTNLISLCDKCHTKTNFNRDYWTNHFNNKIETVISNGMEIISIDREDYDGVVYNLEVEEYHSFAGKGIIYHNSDVQIGWILPAYITKNGNIYKSGVDDKQLWVICEVRDDVKVGQRVIDEINKGTIRSYSIAGSGSDIETLEKNGTTIRQVNSLEILEISLCITPETKVWTKNGLKFIKDIEVGEEVFTHQNRWRKVIKTMQREIDEEILRIYTSDNKSIEITKEHPIRKLKAFGRNLGTFYIWEDANKLNIGDTLSTHIPTGNCLACNAPLFKYKGKGIRDKFCSEECRFLLPGNRKWKTLASGDIGAIKHSQKTKGITKKENPNLKTGMMSPEGRAKQIASVTSDEFRKKRSDIQKEVSNRIESIERMRKLGKEIWENKTEEEKRIHAKKMVNGALYRRGKTKSNEEEQLGIILNKLVPNRYEFVGDWKFTLGGKCPDFIDKENKKLIELWGDYWHKGQNPQDRIDYFKQFGYETCVIWAHEFRDPLLNNRILEFSNNKFVTINMIEPFIYRGTVYNLEVEEDNSYTTEVCVVHNCEKPANPGATFDILKSMPDENNEMFDMNGFIETISDLSITLPGFYVYLEDSESPRVIIVAERTNSLIEEIIKEIKRIVNDKVKIEILSKELMSGEEIPVFKIKLEPINLEAGNENYVEIKDILHDSNIFEQKEDFLKSLRYKIGR